ncbi:hypothetical protein DXG01_007092 [Tephrocybe rancida]|nr:hypothetical protein DXG01_007092 [Tephrocybe rancida]
MVALSTVFYASFALFIASSVSANPAPDARFKGLAIRQGGTGSDGSTDATPAATDVPDADPAATDAVPDTDPAATNATPDAGPAATDTALATDPVPTSTAHSTSTHATSTSASKAPATTSSSPLAGIPSNVEKCTTECNKVASLEACNDATCLCTNDALAPLGTCLNCIVAASAVKKSDAQAIADKLVAVCKAEGHPVNAISITAKNGAAALHASGAMAVTAAIVGTALGLGLV